MDQIEKRDRFIKEWISEAAEKIRDSFQEELIIQEKSNRTDLVTNMDKSTEQFLIGKINKFFPDERIIGEEGFGDSIDNMDGIVWLLDPIDGTLNFVKQQANFAIMIGVYEDGIGQLGYIYDVTQSKMYSAVKGQGAFCNNKRLSEVEDIDLKDGLVAFSNRFMTNDKPFSKEIMHISSGVRMNGSAGLETVNTALGRLAAYIGNGLSPWDIAAGKVIAEEVGLKYTQLDGKELDFMKKNNVLIATAAAHKETIEKYELFQEK